MLSLHAQDARQRTVETVVADVLAAMPAQDANQFASQMADLAATAPESIVRVAAMMRPAAEGVRNNIYEYALSGVVNYVSDPAHKDKAANVVKGLQKAAESCQDAANKAFFQWLERSLSPLPEEPQSRVLSLKEAKALMKSEAIQDRCEAARTIVCAEPSKAVSFLAKALKDNDIQYRNAVLKYATAAAGVEALVPSLVSKYDKMSDAAKADLLNWFGNNKVAAASTIVGNAMAEDGDLALVAISAAGKIGGDKLGTALVDILAAPESAKTEAALVALKSFKGDVQAYVVKGIENSANAEGLMKLASSRGMAKAAPAIFKKYESGDASAAGYLAGVVGVADIQKVGNLLSNAKSEVPQLQDAMFAAVHTLSQAEQYSKVSALVSKAAKPENFYKILALTGADAAVSDLEKAYSNGSSAALAALLDVDNFAAAPLLLNIAKKDAAKVGEVLPRYISLVNKYENNLDKKRLDFGEALELANTDALKVKALNALSGVHTMKAFLLAGKYLGEKGVAYAAANAVKNIAYKTNEEINYADLKANLEKAIEVFQSTGNADDGYAVNEIRTILSEAKPSPVSTLTEEEEKQGFEMLFDGTNLDKWQGDKEGYTPVNGAIYVSAGYGSTGNLYTLKEYRNFVLRFEYCFLREGVNNGVGIRTPMGVDAAYMGMCECQILDHDAPMYANLRDYQVHGSVYGVVPAKRIVHKPLGEWETEEIRVEGNRIKVTVNGEVIVDADIRKACKGHNVAPDGSNVNPYTVDHKNHPGMFNEKGYVSFCGHGEGLKLRNVRILDLGSKK